MDERSAVIDHIAEKTFYRDLSQRRVSFKLRMISPPSIHTLIVFWGKTGGCQTLDEGREAGDDFLSGGRSFSHPIQERGQLSRS